MLASDDHESSFDVRWRPKPEPGPKETERLRTMSDSFLNTDASVIFTALSSLCVLLVEL